MAQEVKVLLICDMGDDRHEADETVAFGLHGAGYELDLCTKHRQALEESFAEFISSARRSGGRTPKSPSRVRSAMSAGKPAYEPEVVRKWAKSNGLVVADAGRLSPTTIKKWRDAGSPGA